MKARVKATGETIDVEKYVDGIYISTDSDCDVYATDDLDFWLNEPSSFDYWARLEHQAAIAAMQAIVTNCGSHDDASELDELLVTPCIEIAHALVKKLKESK